MGKTSLSRGELAAALGYFQRAIELGAGQEAQSLFMRCLFGLQFTAPVPALKPMLLRALRELWAPPADLVSVAAPILLLEPDMRAALDVCDGPQPLEAPAAGRVATDPLLLAMLQDAIITDPQLERLLTGLRRALLKTASDGADAFLPFAAALACQCQAGEYAYRETDEETAAVQSLIEDIADAFRDGQPVNPINLALVGCYRPLDACPWRDEVLNGSWPEILAPVIERQLRAPLKERALRATIPQITPIRDAVSEAVQAQYSENPFPQWQTPPRRVTNFDPQEWLKRTFPKAPSLPPRTKGSREVLVAGCGTGQEPVGLVRLFADVSVLAIDLSLASLAYAKRKTEELGISCISYAQADLLELGSLDRQFDIVVCAGVLHHLADPAAGLRVLRDVTKPGGAMMIALYSELGRREVVAAQRYAAEHGFGTSASELKRFREAVRTLPPGTAWRDALLARDDFYNLSMLRDLVFHVQEARFTVPGIGTMMRGLGLDFRGFAAEPGLYQAFGRRFGPTADVFSLDLWSTFERENPAAFAGMYHFLVQKPAG